MTRLKAFTAILLLIALSGCVRPLTYRNEFTTINNPRARYKQVALQTEGYFADQLAISLKKSMANQGLVEGKSDIAIRVSSRISIFPKREGWFKRRARPLVTTLTVQAIRTSDQEIVYSMVNQYQVLIDKKKGNVITDGWVDKATEQLAAALAKNLLAAN